MEYADEMKELENLIKANHEKANKILGIGNVVEDNGNTIKQVTKDEANELCNLNKEIHETNKRIDELMKGV
jgi:hypothetical protein